MAQVKAPREGRRLQRLMGLLFNISPRKILPLSDLSTRYGCHERTIRRDLELLNDLGYPATVKDGTVQVSSEGIQKFREEMAQWDPEEETLLEELEDE